MNNVACSCHVGSACRHSILVVGQSKQWSKTTYPHMHNAVLLVWSLLRLAPMSNCQPISYLIHVCVTIVQFDAPVSREKGTFYNYGVQLKSGGIYAKHGYHKHATRGTLSLHSLYLLLWMNFSAFCVGLITRQYTEEQLRMLLSDDLPVRSYCISQVRSLWSYMRNNLLALDEELAFLIQRCSNSLLQVLTTQPDLCCINLIRHLSSALFNFLYMLRNPLWSNDHLKENSTLKTNWMCMNAGGTHVSLHQASRKWTSR